MQQLLCELAFLFLSCLKCRNINPQSGNAAIACRTLRNQQPATVRELLFDRGEPAMLSQTFCEPCLLFANRAGILAAGKAVTQQVLEPGPGRNRRRAGRIHLAIGFIAHHQAIAGIVKGKAFRYRVEGVADQLPGIAPQRDLGFQIAALGGEFVFFRGAPANFADQINA
jgi:hypothetical protein